MCIALPPSSPGKEAAFLSRSFSRSDSSWAQNRVGTGDHSLSTPRVTVSLFSRMLFPRAGLGCIWSVDAQLILLSAIAFIVQILWVDFKVGASHGLWPWSLLETWDWVVFVFSPLCFLNEKLNCYRENDRYPISKGLSSHSKAKQSYLIGIHVKNHRFCFFFFFFFGQFIKKLFLIQANSQVIFSWSLLSWREVSPQQLDKTCRPADI